jgi:peptidoglycan/xylan/chitin deacetylase (PgdA/CDA1 family)
MTFDDGPHATLTPKLLDLLAQKKIKATFFVLGENAQRHPEILKRAVAEGHEIGNHSWSHPNLDPLDWKEPGPSVVAQRIIHQTKPGSIMLSHDIHAQTITAMPETFDALLAKGFRFVTVSELLSLAVSSPPPPNHGGSGIQDADAITVTFLEVRRKQEPPPDFSRGGSA